MSYEWSLLIVGLVCGVAGWIAGYAHCQWRNRNW